MAQDQAAGQSAENRIAALLDDDAGHEPESEGVEPEDDGNDPEDVESDESDEAETHEGEDEEEGEPEPRYAVKVDGEEVEVTLSELRAGYQRQTDYTRKTQKLAEERRRSAESERAASETIAKYSEALEALEAQVTPPEPDWDRLRAEDPVAFAEVWGRYQQQQKLAERVRAERARVAEHAQLEAAEALQRRIAEERELLTTVVPEWVDPEVAKRERKALLDYGKTIGFSDQELAGVVDHRAVALLRKAWLYDQAKSRQPKAAKKIQEVRSAPPGAQRKADADSFTRAKKRLQQSGSLADAAQVLTRFL